ncbi:MAG: class I SAM-dependent methyltransferase [Alphaproteobacteria bacterium]|nr:class I SAM-dependent methyltransferase [Alphaproteobacteria bacterium]
MSALGPRLSAFKVVLFLLLPNNIVWSWLLTAQERRELLEANLHGNDERPDFTPEAYQKGNSFDSDADRRKHMDGKWILRFLETYNPDSVLECGPGSGFHTRSIVEYPSVRWYAGCEVNRSFVEFLRSRLDALSPDKLLSAQVFLGDVKEIEVAPVQAVIFSSSLHHMPDRADIFGQLLSLVRQNGYICCVEPTHYLSRWRHLWRKVIMRGYIQDKVRGKTPLTTHHFCTWYEFKELERLFQGRLRIIEVEYDGYRGSLIPRILGKLSRLLGLGWPSWLRNSFPVRLFSSRMMIVFQRI